MNRNRFYFLLLLSVFAIVYADTQLLNLNNAIQYQTVKTELKDEFYPIGFSKEGLFAYLEIPADEAVGCYLWKFKIINLKDDSAVFKLSWNSNRDECEVVSLEDLIKKKGAEFQVALTKFGIIIDSVKQIETFPLKKQNEIIRARLIKGKSNNKHWANETFYQIWMESNLQGKKTIGSVKEWVDDICFICSSHILGYLQSPFESRVVVIVEQQQRGWEGPPNVSVFRLFGSALNTGFKVTHNN